MTVSSLTKTKTVTLATGTDVVATLIHVLDSTHITVERVRSGATSTLSNGVDYTVSDTRVEAGCTVTFIGQASGDIVTITRNIPFSQSGDYVTNQIFPPETNEDGHDKAMMLFQQLQEQIDRCVKFPVESGDTDYGQVIPSLLVRPGTAPYIDANGNLVWGSAGGSAFSMYGSVASKSIAASSSANLVDLTCPTDTGAIVTILLEIEGYGYAMKQEFYINNDSGTIQFQAGMETIYDSNAVGTDTVAVSTSVSSSNHRFTIDGTGLTGTRTILARWKIEPFTNAANINYTAL